MIYEYVLKDHLGNTRIAFGDADADGQPDILQENHYYPFGMAMTMASTSLAAPPNDYLYNGKELQTELGLDWYDYGARMYDASIGRWNGVDALADSFLTLSPFAYVGNNPINSIDPDGDSIIVLTAPNGVARGAGIGHAAVLISDPNNPGQWRLFSSNGAEGGWPFGPQDDPDKGTEVGTLEEFWSGSSSRDEDGNPYYTEGYLLPTDAETDKDMATAALETIAHDYAVIGNSCITLCSNALEAGGFDRGSSNPIPNSRYAAIKENNPGGVVIPNPEIYMPENPSGSQDILLKITREIHQLYR